MPTSAKSSLAGSVFALGALCAAPALALNAAPSSSDAHTMAPDNQTTAPTQQSPALQPGSVSQDLTGQTIYNSKGRQIGTVSSMTVDAKGEQAAIVSIEKYLGMGGKAVEFPVSSLVPRESGGGYTTTLTAKQIEHLNEHTSGSSD